MATKWRKSKGTQKIDYANGKGVRHPCRCKRLFRVALWQEVGNPNAALLAAFQPEPLGTALPGTSAIQWYTREPINESSVNYVPPAAVCTPLFVDGGVYSRGTYPGTAVFASLNFNIVAAADWKLENIYNEKYIVSYFLIEFDSTTTNFLYPDTAAMIAALPGTWTPFAASWGQGYTDISESVVDLPNQGTPYTPNTYTGENDAVPVPSTTETNIAPNSPVTLVAQGLDEQQPLVGAGTGGGSGPFYARRHRRVGAYPIVLKFTDFKFFDTLTFRVSIQRIAAGTGRYYAVLSTTALGSYAAIAAATPRFAITATVGSGGVFDTVDVDLTSNLLRNGRDLWLYLIPGPLVDGPAEVALGAGGIVTRDSAGTGYPTGGTSFTVMQAIELIPTFTYGGTP